MVLVSASEVLLGVVEDIIVEFFDLGASVGRVEVIFAVMMLMEGHPFWVVMASAAA